MTYSRTAAGRPKRRRAAAAIGAALFAASLVGCGGYVGSARRAYTHGRYLEAAEKLGQHEREIGELSPRRRAEYGMYRGLSLMMLGDVVGAHYWLGFAYSIEQMQPGTLKDEQRALLDRGLLQLAQILGQAGPATAEGVFMPAPPAVAPAGPARPDEQEAPPPPPPPPEPPPRSI